MAGKAKKAIVDINHPPIPVGEVLHDKITSKRWRLGPAVGSGGFGVIYSACDHDKSSKNATDYPFVVKIEPHDNGSLFVEKLFYIRNAIKSDIAAYMKSKKLSTFGMPEYLGSGSHDYNGQKFRYLVMERFGKDVWSLFNEAGCAFRPATVFQIGLQLLDVLEYIHGKGYLHSDVKGTNILVGLKKGTEHQTYLIDFGLASRINNKEFKPDKKFAHNGTIEYTSRDAHLGVPTMRGDIEILAYNMLHWLVGELPWENSIKQPETVQKMKEDFMNNIQNIKKTHPIVPDAIVKLFQYVNSLKPKDTVDYTKVRPILADYLKSLNIKTNKLDFTKAQSRSNSDVTAVHTARNVPKQKIQNGVTKAVKRGGNRVKPAEDNYENKEPVGEEVSPAKRKKVVVVAREVLAKAKSAKVSRATPPTKKKYTNATTQTSAETLDIHERPRRSLRFSPRQVSYDSPISEIIEEENGSKSENNKSPSFSNKDRKKTKYSKEKETVENVVSKQSKPSKGRPKRGT